MPRRTGGLFTDLIVKHLLMNLTQLLDDMDINYCQGLTMTNMRFQTSSARPRDPESMVDNGYGLAVNPKSDRGGHCCGWRPRCTGRRK